MRSCCWSYCTRYLFICYHYVSVRDFVIACVFFVVITYLKKIKQQNRYRNNCAGPPCIFVNILGSVMSYLRLYVGSPVSRSKRLWRWRKTQICVKQRSEKHIENFPTVFAQTTFLICQSDPPKRCFHFLLWPVTSGKPSVCLCTHAGGGTVWAVVLGADPTQRKAETRSTGLAEETGRC